jgi:hypothetical protein
MDVNELPTDEDLIKLTHDFEADLHRLVIANHRFTMEGIARDEAEGMAEVEAELDWEAHSGILNAYQNHYEGLKIAARNLAMVGLVTRLQHWASFYARRIDPKRERGQSLDTELGFLNSHLGGGPAQIDYFIELAEVRHSVIHADSQPTWTYKGKTRSVAPCYAPSNWRVELTDDQLTEAIEKAIAQIKLYDEKLIAIQQ